MVLGGPRPAAMHVQILERVWELTAGKWANAPHSWAMLMKPPDGRNRATGWNVKGPAIRAWGQYHSRVIGSTGGQYGPLEGATAEKAVPFPCAARRSLDLRGRSASGIRCGVAPCC